MHGGEYRESFAFWAESQASPRDSGKGAKAKNEKKKGATRQARRLKNNTAQIPQRYETAASPDQLKDILKIMELPTDVVSQTHASLPTIGSTPIPSGYVISDSDEEADNGSGDGDANNGHAGTGAASEAKEETKKEKKKPTGGKPKLAKYAIDVAWLPAEDAVTLLSKLIGRKTAGTGTIIGADLAYLCDVLRMAGAIVARQQYLPDIRAGKGYKNSHFEYGDGDGEAYHAVWRPIITAGTLEDFEALARRMPGAIQAFSYGNSGKTPTESAAGILMRILTIFVSHLVRISVYEDVPRRAGRRRKNFDSMHDAWMYQLKSATPSPLEDANVTHLAGQVREWQHPITILANSPLRLCFRLEEPGFLQQRQTNGIMQNNKKWTVRYLLQSRDDPSLLIPARDAWEDASPVLQSDGMTTKEFLLISLGQASGIFSGIARGMSGKNAAAGMGMCTLGTKEAHDFLTGEAAALEQAGYVIMLPTWWTGKRTAARIKAHAKILAPTMKARTGILNLDSIIQFDWTVAVGDKSLTREELNMLADAKTPLVNIRGEWVEVRPDDIRQAAEFLKKKTSKATLRDVIKMKLGVGQQAIGTAGAKNALDITVGGGDGSDGAVLQILRHLDEGAEFEQIVQPGGFSGTLRPYQVRGFSWMAFLQKWGLGGCLADDMGLGKTIQILALVQQYRQEGGARPFLIICPTSVMSNWQKEAARFTEEIPVMIHHGPGRKSGAAFKKTIKKYGIVISSYGLLHRDIKTLKEAGWAGAILDEAQNVKNPQTKQAQAARTISADCRFALTGTPVENNVGDLWSIMEFLNPGFLGTETQFKGRFFIPIQNWGDASAANMLKQATAPFIMRRLKTDKTIITDLPEKIETKTYCPLTREQTTLYEAVVSDIMNAIEMAEGIQRKGIILSSLAKLKQVCDHPAIFLKDGSGAAADGGRGQIRSGKLARLIEMLTEVTEAGRSALVFTQFVEMGHMLRRHLQETFGREVFFLHGSVPRKGRDEMVRRFQEEAGPRLFVISLKAGGTGLNLTAASHVFHFDRWWNPAVEDQATDRAFRIGQKNNVQVHKMICQGTLEEKIDELIEHKKDITKKVIGTGEAWITEMSDRDLRDVLKLSSDAARGGAGDEEEEEEK